METLSKRFVLTLVAVLAVFCLGFAFYLSYSTSEKISPLKGEITNDGNFDINNMSVTTRSNISGMNLSIDRDVLLNDLTSSGFTSFYFRDPVNGNGKYYNSLVVSLTSDESLIDFQLKYEDQVRVGSGITAFGDDLILNVVLPTDTLQDSSVDLQNRVYWGVLYAMESNFMNKPEGQDFATNKVLQNRIVENSVPVVITK